MRWDFSVLILFGIFLTGCAFGEAYTGYPMTKKGQVSYEQSVYQAERTKQEANITKERAEILSLYKNCLTRKEQDPNVDCSEFRTALEIKVRGE